MGAVPKGLERSILGKEGLERHHGEETMILRADRSCNKNHFKLHFITNGCRRARTHHQKMTRRAS